MDKLDSKLPSWLLICVAAAIGMAVGLLFLYFNKFWGELSGSQEVWGQFGDFLGGILNPLFSIVGLMALLYTIRLQSREMANSTLELSRSAEALNQQNYHNEQQSYDSRLFHLMSLHSQTLAQLSLVPAIPQHLLFIKGGGTPTVFTGGKAINYALKRLLVDRFVYLPGEAIEADIEKVRRKYDEWREENWTSLSRYFASVRNLVAFISSAAKYRPNKFAIELLRSQLDSDEQMLIICVCCFEKDMRSSLGFLIKHGFGGVMFNGLDFAVQIDFILNAKMEGDE